MRLKLLCLLAFTARRLSETSLALSPRLLLILRARAPSRVRKSELAPYWCIGSRKPLPWRPRQGWQCESPGTLFIECLLGVSGNLLIDVVS
eukprot:IDg13751t1